MTVSKIEICNVALAMLGADAIRSFDDKNKRARMADVFFDFTRDYLLTKFDWPFARKLAKLNPLDATTMIVPAGEYPYQLPNDCHAARSLHPRRSQDPWYVLQDVLYCRRVPSTEYDLLLQYTFKAVDVSKYSSTFNNLLASGLAVKMSPSITQDKALTAELGQQFLREQQDAWEADANVGDGYREPDEDPNNDSFVYPDGFFVTEPEIWNR